MMLKFKKGGYARHDSGTVYKVKDIFPNKYNPQVLFVSLVTRGRRFKVHICPNCLMWSDDTRAVIARETVSKFKLLREKEDISISNE